MTIPGVQKPHWLAPVEQNASPQAAASPAGSPSSVVIDRPLTRRAGVTQATRGCPSTSTVQHPLALGAAAVLDRHHAQALAQDRQQRGAVVRHLDRAAV